ncbi:MAG: HD domain-containing protein [Spirochaetales bacterium]
MLDIKKITDIYLQYVRENFNLSDTNLMRKYKHVQKVAEYAFEIAKSLNLNEEDRALAYVCGLFHDFGRFFQWREYGTYYDLQSFDHAKRGIELLFDQGLIKRFDIPEKYYMVLKTSLAEHNKINLSPELKDERLILFSKILRDADKLNLYELNISGELPTFTEIDGVTIEVLDAIKNGVPVNKYIVKTKLDRALLSLATTYDLNFEYSFKKLIDIHYYEGLYDRFLKILKDDDCRLLNECIIIAKRYLKDKI